MIDLTKVAEVMENGLNAVFNDPEITFKIWSQAGKYKKPFRQDNQVFTSINGTLRVSSSSDEATLVVMGVSGLTLDFAVPLRRPKTNAAQTAEELRTIKDGQYPFLNEITNVIQRYFQISQSIEIADDADGTVYSVGIRAGMGLPDAAALEANYGEFVKVSVYIDFTYIAGGVISRDITVEIDGEAVPFQSLRAGRAPDVERNVAAGNSVCKNAVTSTAFTLEFEFPTSANPATDGALDFLINGKPNVAHFVSIAWGGKAKGTYFMTMNTVNGSAQGILVAGLSVSMMQVMDYSEVADVPASYGLAKLKFSDSSVTQVTISRDQLLPAYLTTCIAGKIEEWGLTARSVTVPLSESDFEYDETDDAYCVYVVSSVKTGFQYKIPDDEATYVAKIIL